MWENVGSHRVDPVVEDGVGRGKDAGVDAQIPAKKGGVGDAWVVEPKIEGVQLARAELAHKKRSS